MRDELREKGVLIESSRKEPKEKKRGDEGQGRGPEEVTNRWRYEICVQECFHGIPRVLYHRALEYARLEISEL